MTLMVLLLILVTPYAVLTLAGRWKRRLQIARAARARAGLSLFLIFTSTGHFIMTEGMATMLPPHVPYRTELVLLTGALELLGAVGIWVPPVMRLTGLLIILMLVGFLPVNVYSAANRIEFGGHGAGPIYLLVRVPFQLFVIWWTRLATRDTPRRMIT